MRRLTAIFVIVLAAAAVTLWSSLFVVDEREQALVLQFGEVVATKRDPGLGVKLPFIQDVVTYEDRILSLDSEPVEIIPRDNRRLVVDLFARWRISDPIRFRQAINTEFDAAERLEGIIDAAMRDAIGTVTSEALLSADRTALMTRIRDAAKISAESFGVELIDVRIKRADLPQANLAATFERMKAERNRIAADQRARGQEQAQLVRATADRTATETESEARKEAEIVRGEADATRNRIFANAYGIDPEFFAFYRSLVAYERALKGTNSSLVISPDSEFFDYLKSDTSVTAPPNQ
ncbi:MAG: protease modulator HflC [Pseudomonadota bacterium]